MNEVSQPGLPEDAIAVVGMSVRFPGARSVDAFWKNVAGGVESVRRLSDEQLISVGVPRSALRNPSYVKAAAPLEGMECFDASFFGITAKEARIMDPQHRQFLATAWESLEHAGHAPERFDGAIGVFAGCGMNSYMMLNLVTNQDLVESEGLWLLRHTANDKDFLATRVSYALDLKGPSVNVQTACSTSLVAIHLACQSLLGFESDMALAGGVTIEFPHRQGYVRREGSVLSPDGHCRAFDHRAAGTVFGSGAGVVVLRRLADAVRDGDRIHAIVRGSALNNDGAGKVSYFAPSVDGQAAVYSEALAVAGVEARTVGLVETHGTGTSMGDPLEISALTQAYGASTDEKQFCAIGSVKTNVGHLDTAAGVASFVKAVSALEHRQIPPSLNYERANPLIDFEASPFYVSTELRGWPAGPTPRRAAVSALGVGGTNAHIILEEAPVVAPAAAPARVTQVLPVSARSAEALEMATSRLAAHLREQENPNLADIAYTLQLGRRSFERRRVVACSSVEEALELLEQRDRRRVFTRQARVGRTPLAFMYPGVATQYRRMGAGLYESEPVFREHVDRGLDLLAPRVDFDLRSLLFADSDEAARELDRPSIQTPAIFIVEYALTQLWKSLGVEPEALIGLSLGENTASAVAGVLSFEDCLGLVALRGRIFEDVTDGGMLSVPLAAEALAPRLGDELEVATVNAPEFCAVSGPVPALERLAATLRDEGLEASRVNIATACHSRLLDPHLPRFERYLRSIELHPPAIPFVSNRSGTWITDEQATDPMYWVRHLRETVHFAAGVGCLLETKGRVLLEVGPGKGLSSLARINAAADAELAAIPSMRHAHDETPDEAVLLTAFGQLWASGAEVDWRRLHGDARRLRVPLPTYPFQETYHFVEPGVRQVGAPEAPEEASLRLPFDEWFSEVRWRSEDLPQFDPALFLGARRSWLVFIVPSLEPVAQALEELGHGVVRVHPGGRFEQRGDAEFALDPAREDDYAQLLRALADRGAPPAQVLHCWSVTGEADRPTLEECQERGFSSLFYLVRALASEGLEGAFDLSVLSDGMQSVEGEPLPYPEKATLLGPCRVITREFPELRVRSIDLPTCGADPPSVLALLLGETDVSTAALRGGRLWIPERVPLADAAQAESDAPARGVELRAGGVVLITGGLGGVGLGLARSLTASHGSRLILTSRAGLPPREQWEALVDVAQPGDVTARRIADVRQLERAGAEVLVCAADVADAAAMTAVRDAAEQRFGAIDGVIHAAGVLEDGLILLKAPAAIERVMRPKVAGALVLDQVFEGRALDFMVLCSSTSSQLGLAGQVDYTGANAFLNAFARARSARGAGYTTALCWGTWAEVGMAADAARAQGLLPGLDVDRVQATGHPLLGDRVSHGPDEFAFSAEYSTDMWILDEHRIRGFGSLIPGTGYVEILRAAAEAAGVSATVRIEDLLFQAPMQVADGESRRVRICLTKGRAGYDGTVQSQTGVDAQGRELWRTHVRASLVDEQREPAGAVSITEVSARCPRVLDFLNGDGRTQQEEHLQFGPRWKNLQWVRLGQGEALAALRLPEAFVSDLERIKVHPALLDMATGAGLPLVPGYSGSGTLYIPMMYDRITVLGPLEGEVFSHLRLRADGDAGGDVVTFDVALLDAQGRTMVEVEGFTMRRIEGELSAEADAGADRPLASPTLEGVPDADMTPFQAGVVHGIRPDEGAQALHRVLAAGAGPEVIVSSLDWGWLIEKAGPRPGWRRQGQDGAQAGADKARAKTKARPAADAGDSRQARIVQELIEIIQDLGGLADGDPDPYATFVELGFDSLLVTRANAKIQRHYDVRITFRQLFEDTPTLDSLAEFIDGELPAQDASGAAAPARAADQALERLSPDGFPVTDAQAEILLACLMDQDASRAFNISVSVDLDGELDRDCLCAALQGVVDRHEALRITFSADGSFQRIAPELVVAPTEVDLGDLDADEQAARLAAFLDEDARRPFDLVEGPLVRFSLVRFAPDRHRLVISAHHIVCDGWSTGGVAVDVGMLYSAAREQREPEPAQPTMSFTEYVAGELHRQRGEEGARATAHWLATLDGELPVLDFPTDRPRPPVKTFRGDQASHQLDRAFFGELKSFAARHRGTVFSTVLAAYGVLLKRLSGQDDVVVGFTNGGQASVGASDLVGHCVNLLPFRSRLDTGQPFTAHMAEVQGCVMDSMEFRDCTYGTLLKSLGAQRDTSRLPLMSTYLTYEVGPDLRFAGLRPHFSSNLKPFTNFDLELYVEETADGLRLCFHYNTDLHDAATMQRWLRYLATMLRGIVADAERSMAELPMLLEEERRQLVEAWNDTRARYPEQLGVHQLLEASARERPSSDAVVLPAGDGAPGETLTYGELNARANQLARALRARGVGAGDLVALCAERSPAMLVGLFGVLKAGAAYVPLDPHFPAERLQYMLEDSAARVLVSESRVLAKLGLQAEQVLCLDSEREALAAESADDLELEQPGAALAYVIYTSGSTGRPKGVMIPHRAVVNFLCSMAREPGLTSADRMLAVTTLSFDIAVLELVLPLTVGAQVVLARSDEVYDGPRLIELLESQGISAMQATPATWRIMLEAGWRGRAGLKVLCGGEALPVELAHALAERCDALWNMYGPTETTIWSAVARIEPGAEEVLIGRPIANTETYVLDARLQPVPVGVSGELFIGGDGLARGYWRRDELTRERFIAHPFHPHDEERRLYRTGDLARFRASGELECLGRVDNQVKLRGFRIELGEIESVLEQQHGVEQAVVVAWGRSEGERQLVAYLRGPQELLPHELRDQLGAQLPDYMVPFAYVWLDEYPLTANGKVDRKALPDPDLETAVGARDETAPRTEAERALARVWCELLNLEQVGIHTTFADAGGYSLLALRLVSRVRDSLGVELRVRDVFETPTLAGLAALIESRGFQDSAQQADEDMAEFVI